METSWKKIIARFCIIVAIIFSASYVVGEYRIHKEEQEISAQLEEKEKISTEIRNKVLTGKAGVKDKLLGYEDVNLTRLYIYAHAYNQMVDEDERIIIDDLNPDEENEIGNLDELSKEFISEGLFNNDVKEYMDANVTFDYFDDNIADTERPFGDVKVFIYRVGSSDSYYDERIKEYDFQIRLLANDYGSENPKFKCERDEYGDIEHYDLSIQQVNELIRKYDLKELYGVEYQINDDVMLKTYDE